MHKYLEEYSSLFPDRGMVRVFTFFLVFECIFILSMYFFPHTILILYVVLFISAFINLNAAIVLLLITDPIYFIIRNQNASDAVLVAVFREVGIGLILGLILGGFLIGSTVLVKRKQAKEVWPLLCLLLIILMSAVQTKNALTYLLGLREHLFPMLFLFFLIFTNSAKRVPYLMVSVYIQIIVIILLEGYNLIFPESRLFSTEIPLDTAVEIIVPFRELFGISGNRVFNSMFSGSPGFGCVILSGVGISFIIWGIHSLRKRFFLITLLFIPAGLCLLFIALKTFSYSIFSTISFAFLFYSVFILREGRLHERTFLFSIFIVMGIYWSAFSKDIMFLADYLYSYFTLPIISDIFSGGFVTLILGNGMGVRTGELLGNSNIIQGVGDCGWFGYIFYFGLVGFICLIYFVVIVLRKAVFVFANDRAVYGIFCLFIVSFMGDAHYVPFTLRPFFSLLIPLIAIISYRAGVLIGKPYRSVLVPAQTIDGSSLK